MAKRSKRATFMIHGARHGQIKISHKSTQNAAAKLARSRARQGYSVTVFDKNKRVVMVCERKRCRLVD